MCEGDILYNIAIQQVWVGGRGGGCDICAIILVSALIPCSRSVLLSTRLSGVEGTDWSGVMYCKVRSYIYYHPVSRLLRRTCTFLIYNITTLFILKTKRPDLNACSSPKSWCHAHPLRSRPSMSSNFSLCVCSSMYESRSRTPKGPR